MMRMMALWVLLLSACQPEFKNHNPFTWHKKDASYFQQLTNSQKLPTKVQRQQILKLVNDSYPIELALFADGKFYYFLENLGDGAGTWTHHDGGLELYAERDLFVMDIGMHAISEHDTEVAIDFTDRFGTQYLRMDIIRPKIAMK